MDFKNRVISSMTILIRTVRNHSCTPHKVNFMSNSKTTHYIAFSSLQFCLFCTNALEIKFGDMSFTVNIISRSQFSEVKSTGQLCRIHKNQPVQVRERGRFRIEGSIKVYSHLIYYLVRGCRLPICNIEISTIFHGKFLTYDHN